MKSRPPHRFSYVVAAVATVSLLVVSCGDDDDSAGAGATSLADQQAWCDLVNEIDVELVSTEGEDVPFATSQEVFASVTPSVARLRDNIDLVDESARTDVDGALEMLEEMAAIVASSDDTDEVWARTSELFTDDEDPFAAAAVWIDEACGVDIED